MIVERADALGHDAVEATDLFNHLRHSLTLVSKPRIVKTSISHPPVRKSGAIRHSSLTRASEGGRYTVREGGRVGERGTVAITAHGISFGHETGFLACPGCGLYKWELTGKRLKFTRIKDRACPGRAGVLAQAFTRVS
jgi:hypothetical protein